MTTTMGIANAPYVLVRARDYAKGFPHYFLLNLYNHCVWHIAASSHFRDVKTEAHRS